MNNTNFIVTLYSTSFNVTDSVVSVQPYDASNVPLTAWTIKSGQYQDTTGMTITAVFTAGDGMPVTASPQTGGAHSPSPAHTTASILITTGGGVTVTVPVKPITISPCP